MNASVGNFPWALRMAREDAAALAGLRLTPGVEVAEDGRQIWLRGQRADESLAVLLFALPAAGRYEWLPPSQLRELDRRIPSSRLPELEWHSLHKWLQVQSPLAAIAGDLPAAVALRLVRTGMERTPDVLLTRLDAFQEFARRAALVRLERLQFAAAADGRVLIRGTPLPPLPGQRFVTHGGVAVPAGYNWHPAVSAEVMARRLGAPADALVLWNEDGTVTRLHKEQFVAASRSAVMATAAVLRETA